MTVKAVEISQTPVVDLLLLLFLFKEIFLIELK